MTDTTNMTTPTHNKSTWKRGLYMLAFLLLTKLAGTILAVITVIQFFWMLAKGEKHNDLTRFGRGLGRWFRAVVSFQTGETDEKPFPWQAWPSDKAP